MMCHRRIAGSLRDSSSDKYDNYNCVVDDSLTVTKLLLAHLIVIAFTIAVYIMVVASRQRHDTMFITALSLPTMILNKLISGHHQTDIVNPPEYTAAPSITKDLTLLKLNIKTVASQLQNQTQKPTGSKSLRKLGSLKQNGTVLRHSTPDVPQFVYNVFDTDSNPCRTLYDSDQLRISLEMDHQCYYLSGLHVDSDMALDNEQENINADASTANGSISGKLVVTVKGPTGVLFQNFQVRLSCYASEFVYSIDASSNMRVIKLLRSPSSNQFSYYTPMLQDVIYFNGNNGSDAASVPDHGITLLSPGTYHYPFTFVGDATSFPSTVSTRYGSTSYRVEAFMTLPKPNLKYETIILTSSLAIKKTLSSESISLYDSVISRNTWREGMLDYDVFLSSRMVEFDKPFQFSLQLLRNQLDSCKILSISLSIIQKILIPCVNHKSGEALSGYHIENNISPITTITEFSTEELCYNLTLNDLVVPSNLKSSVCNKSFNHYHCENSSQLTYQNKPKYMLKISHEIKVKIGIEVKGGEKVQLSLKIPILLVDQDMSSTLYLPRYEASAPKRLAGDLYQFQSEDSSLFPPEYTEMPIYPDEYTP